MGIDDLQGAIREDNQVSQTPTVFREAGHILKWYSFSLFTLNPVDWPVVTVQCQPRLYYSSASTLYAGCAIYGLGEPST